MSSALESVRFLEKNEAFEAVIGVLGVLAFTRRGGGVVCPSEYEVSLSWRAAILAVVGVLNGNRFSGGRRRGCRFFFLTGAALLCWSSDVAVGPYFLTFGSRSFFGGSRIEPLPDKLLVEVLLILLASKGILDFRLKNGGSAGESFGDSYAFGIAGTGGTSSSSLFPVELCTFLGFGVGSLDEDGGSCIRGCNERLRSGVVLLEDGVDTFLGNIEGDLDDVRMVDDSG